MKTMNEYEVILNGFYNSEDGKPNFFVRDVYAKDKNEAQIKAIKILEEEGIVTCSIVTTLTKSVTDK